MRCRHVTNVAVVVGVGIVLTVASGCGRSKPTARDAGAREGDTSDLAVSTDGADGPNDRVADAPIPVDMAGTDGRDANEGGADLAPTDTGGGGGASSGGRGGTAGTGGSAGTGGMTTLVGTGGSTATGGSNSTGGSMGSGGSTSTGGSTSSGGSTGTGGSDGTGGVTSTGGSDGTGGVTSTGGSDGTGGVTSTGGSDGTGGVTSTGGSDGTGGSGGTGGSTATGGAGGGGGSAGGAGGTAGPPITPCAPGGRTLPALCSVYCSVLDADCTGSDMQFPSLQSCLDACNLPTWSCGNADDTNGDSVWCRTYYVAAVDDDPSLATVNCPLAGPNSTACH